MASTLPARGNKKSGEQSPDFLFQPIELVGVRRPDFVSQPFSVDQAQPRQDRNGRQQLRVLALRKRCVLERRGVRIVGLPNLRQRERPQDLVVELTRDQNRPQKFIATAILFEPDVCPNVSEPQFARVEKHPQARIVDFLFLFIPPIKFLPPIVSGQASITWVVCRIEFWSERLARCVMARRIVDDVSECLAQAAFNKTVSARMIREAERAMTAYANLILKSHDALIRSRALLGAHGTRPREIRAETLR